MSKPLLHDNRLNDASIHTHVNEHYGDHRITLDFPKTWKVRELKITGHNMPTLTDAQIRDALAHPIGTSTIGEMAKSKKGRIVVTCDDLTRPTPAYRVFPFIVEELNNVGISDSQILILGAQGCHHPMTIGEFARKVGWDMVAKFNCVSHNLFWHLSDVGTTSHGTHLLVNKAWAKADLRIVVCGIKQHEEAGAGGSGKSVLPGVASIESIKWNHSVVGTGYRSVWPKLPSYKPTQGKWVIKGNTMRADIQEAARMAELNITVNCNYNHKRELLGLQVGDLDEAWHKAVRFAYKTHSTQPLREKVDIVVLNFYPQAWGTFGGVGIDWRVAKDTLREGGSAVAIAFRPWEASFVHYYEEWHASPLANFFLSRHQPTIPQAGQTIVYTNNLVRRAMMQYNDEVKWTTEWSDVIKSLRTTHGEYATVAFYHCANLQFDPKKLPLKL